MACHCHDHGCSTHEHHHDEHEEKFEKVMKVINWIRIPLAVILVIAYYILHLGFPSLMESNQNLETSMFVLLTVMYIFMVFDLVYDIVKGIIKGKFSYEGFLMFIATVGAYVIGAYEESILVLVFYRIGEILEDYATDKARKSVKSLINNIPLVAHVYSEGAYIDKKPEDVKIDEIIEVKPGEKLALDGVVIKGHSSLDMSSLNGESIPQDVKINSPVYSGSVNTTSSIWVKVTKEYKNSTLTNIMNLVESEQAKKSKSENFITKFAKIYTPTVVLLAVLYFFIPFAIKGFIWEGYGENYFKGALNLLLISCPCSLVISVPLTYFAYIGKASRLGILIKGSINIESLSKSDIFVFDKTGTLTKGDFILLGDYNKENMMIAKSLEMKTNHPISKAFIKHEDVDTYMVDSFEIVQGQGVKGFIQGKEYFIGNLSYIRENGIVIEEKDTPYKVLYLANITEKKALDAFLVADEVKIEAEKAIAALKKEGVRKTSILSGDNSVIVDHVKNEIKIDEAKGDLFPQEKLERLNELKYENKKKHIITYVGDGINDSPSLLASDVGIAMGGLGSDAAKEAAGIVILNDNLLSVSEVKRLSKKAMTVIFENISAILLVKFAVMVLTLPVFDFATNDWWMLISIASDVGLLILAILNSIRGLFYKPAYIKQNK